MTVEDRCSAAEIRHEAGHRWWLACAGALLVAGLIAPAVVIGAGTGAFGIPHNNDWSFLRSTARS